MEESSLLSSVQQTLAWASLATTAGQQSQASRQTVAAMASLARQGVDRLARQGVDRRKRGVEVAAGWNMTTWREDLVSLRNLLEQLSKDPKRVIGELLLVVTNSTDPCSQEDPAGGSQVACRLEEWGALGLIREAYRVVSGHMPVWRPLEELTDVRSGLTRVEDCKVNVNILDKYLGDEASLENVVKCTGRIDKREIGDGPALADIMATIDMEGILANLTQWRLEEFSELDWTEEYQNLTERVIRELDNIVNQVESILSPTVMTLFNPDELLGALMASPEFSQVLDSLKTILKETFFLMENTEYADDIVRMMAALEDISSLPIFQTGGLTVAAAFTDWDTVAAALKDKTELSEAEIDSLSRLEISSSLMVLVYLKASSLYSHLCDSLPPLFTRYITLFPTTAPLDTSAENITVALCSFLQVPEDASLLLAQLDLQAAKVNTHCHHDIQEVSQDYLTAASDLAPSSLAAQANITEEELFQTMDRCRRHQAKGDLFSAGLRRPRWCCPGRRS